MKDSMGLPCIHVIDMYLRANAGSLQVTDFNLQWHLQPIATFPPLDPRLQIRKPDAIQPRGRPTEAGPLVLPHAALALLVVNLPDSRMKRQAASRLV